MKYLYILFVLLLGSCSLSKESTCDSKKLEKVSKVDTVSFKKEENNLESNEEYIDHSAVETPSVSSPISKNIITEYNIVNYTDTTKVLDNGFGTIAYNIPDKFRVDEYSTIKLRISKSKEVESVVIGDRNIPIIGTKSNDEIIVETIKIDNLMSANLYTDESLFEVSMVNKNNEQSLYKDGYTEWVWRVRPLKPGNHYIKMLITISGRDIVVYEKNIPVESNWKFSFSEWFSEWWQAITATIITPIIIPFIVWFYRKRKKTSN